MTTPSGVAGGNSANRGPEGRATIPLAVLVARLEHELETARLAVKATVYTEARDSVKRASEITKAIREAL